MTKCPYTGKEGYVEEEDCHCFCCGVHDGLRPKEQMPKRVGGEDD